MVWGQPCLKTSPLLTAETPRVKPTLWGIRQRYQGGEQYTDPFLCNSKPAPPPTRSCILGLDTAQTRITDGDSSSIIPQRTATALFIKLYKISGYPTQYILRGRQGRKLLLLFSISTPRSWSHLIARWKWRITAQQKKGDKRGAVWGGGRGRISRGKGSSSTGRELPPGSGQAPL